jgi:uncharacterized Tic20 family protein
MLHFSSGIRIYIGSMILWIMLLDDKPKILLDTLHATNRDVFPAIYILISILLTLIGAISKKQEIFKWKETREILLKVACGR